jgi:membrane protein YqaA with SNARE-associated domain
VITWSVVLGAFLGSVAGNFVFLYIVGRIAQRAEKKRVEQMNTQLLKLQNLAEKENERMKKYAEMEG